MSDGGISGSSLLQQKAHAMSLNSQTINDPKAVTTVEQPTAMHRTMPGSTDSQTVHCSVAVQL